MARVVWFTVQIVGAAFALACVGTAADSIDRAGQEPHERCGYCHEIDGNSRMEAAPRIAAQPRAYLVKQLQDFAPAGGPGPCRPRPNC